MNWKKSWLRLTEYDYKERSYTRGERKNANVVYPCTTIDTLHTEIKTYTDTTHAVVAEYFSSTVSAKHAGWSSA